MPRPNRSVLVFGIDLGRLPSAACAERPVRWAAWMPPVDGAIPPSLSYGQPRWFSLLELGFALPLRPQAGPVRPIIVFSKATVIARPRGLAQSLSPRIPGRSWASASRAFGWPGALGETARAHRGRISAVVSIQGSTLAPSRSWAPARLYFMHR